MYRARLRVRQVTADAPADVALFLRSTLTGGIPIGAALTTTLTTAPQWLEFDFEQSTAGAANRNLTLRLGSAYTTPADGPRYIAVDGFELLRFTEGPPWLLTTTVYESTLANHLDVACASVRARWWAGADGTLRFARPAPAAEPVAHFTDDTTAHPDAEPYHSVAEGTSTASIVNQLAMTNHGVQWDTTPGAGGWLANDVETTHTDVTSVATWRPRAAAIDTSIHDAGPYADHPGEVARAYLTDTAGATASPPWLRYEATRNPGLVAQLDLNALIAVTRAGVTHACRITAIAHTVTPTAWHVTYDLTPHERNR
jgi:hypothetical protein